ncbi:uncharacterized protein [Centruroides vittatus]|uniref:uncharacterized protein n=1 Tax=Centruroides vittatus TaxID=120091 RepID=UPI003510C393
MTLGAFLVLFTNLCILSITARGKAVSEDLRNAIIAKHSRGMSERAISKELMLSKTTVHQIIVYYANHGHVIPNKAAGHQRKTSKVDDRNLKRIVKNNCRATALNVTTIWNDTTGKNVSVSTTCKRLQEMHFQFYEACEKPLLTAYQKKKRVQ